MKRLRRRDIRAKKRRQQVPTEADWENYKDDLDTEYAHRAFIGRTNEEMQPRFFENPIEMTDELRWMPRIPFQYYMVGFRDALVSPGWGPCNDSDAASCFLRLVLEKLERQPTHILAIMPDLLPTIEDVAQNQLKFNANEKIYGSFLELLEQIRTRYHALGG